MCDVKCAVFDDEDGVTVTLHSGKLKRQVSFERTNAGDATVTTIDENMERIVLALQCGKPACPLADALEWLHGKPAGERASA